MGAVELVDRPVHKRLKKGTKRLLTVDCSRRVGFEESDRLAHRGAGQDLVRDQGHFGFEPVKLVPAPLVGFFGVDLGPEELVARQRVPVGGVRRPEPPRGEPGRPATIR